MRPYGLEKQLEPMCGRASGDLEEAFSTSVRPSWCSRMRRSRLRSHLALSLGTQISLFQCEGTLHGYHGAHSATMAAGTSVLVSLPANPNTHRPVQHLNKGVKRGKKKSMPYLQTRRICGSRMWNLRTGINSGDLGKF